MINKIVVFPKYLRSCASLSHKQYFRNSTAVEVRDPYYILGVDKNADIAEIKKAFYKLAT